ncbi:Major facilitator superfamily MFS 1 protein [Halorhabdus tiamatea SARL4B]|uniref:Major facilitator superfamily MFS 1 protein n=1 Tax=Halorhabdus tiamatea SARL4B TaxID=1033806 RepID=F7PM28_9EURY|nr:MFS transporter [Halorhabdus tiamatea]ERJ06363.1 Major facilitator superfamily MFS 1 protein [Halorhabdus tiamatea SARL4B]CCQ34531.1 nucleoside/H+ symporter, major facilitator superfamily MFS_1 [Halorhabdus tiamatea SARL4B]
MISDERRYQFIYLVLYAAANGISGYRNVFFEDIGLSESQMGMIGAVLIGAGIVAQPLWGVLADAYGRTKLVMAVGAIVSIVGGLLFPIGTILESPYLLMLIAAAIYSAFRAPIIPLANAMVLSAGIDFGNVRAFGSIAFGIGILAMGPLVGTFGTVSIFVVYALGMTVFVLSIRGVPQPSSADLSPDLREDSLRLLTDPRFVLLLIVGVFFGAATTTGGAFFSVYIRAIEAGDAMTGAAWFVRTLAEAAIFVWAVHLGLEHRTQLVVGAVLSAVSFLLYVIPGTLPVTFLAQLPRGAGFALFTLASVSLAHEYAPDTLSGSAQALLAALGLGTGRVFGQVAGGWLADVIGVQGMYLYLAAAAGIGAVLSLGFFLGSVRTALRRVLSRANRR